MIKTLATSFKALRYFVYYYIWRWFVIPVKHQGCLVKGTLSVNSKTNIYFESFVNDNSNKETLVLLHGGLTSITAWFAQMPYLAKHYNLICIDLRGQGRSTLGDEPFSYRLFASDILQVLDHLNIPTFHIAGWSDGGNVGLLTSLMQPARLKSLITIGSNYHYSGLKASAQKDIHHDDAFRYPIAARCLYWIESSHPEQWPELVKKTLALWRDYPRLTEADIAAVTTPTLCIIGENDMISQAHTKTMTYHMPNAEHKIIPKRGHNLLFTEPQLISQLIIAFIQKKAAVAALI